MSILDILIVVILISWIGGFSLHLGGNLIHILLVVLLVVVILRVLGVTHA